MPKRNVDPEDAVRLNALLRDAKIGTEPDDVRGYTEFAAAAGAPLTGALIYQHRDGRTRISLEAAMAYAKGLGVPIGAISPSYESVIRRGAALLGRPNDTHSSSVASLASEPSRPYLTTREEYVLNVFRELPEHLREQLLSYAQGMAAANKGSTKKIG